MGNDNTPRDVFRVRLNCVDHYQHAPSSLDPPLWGASSISSTQKHSLPQVPVIRVFGSTETGQKVCAHIHGAYPYLYIPYTEALDKQHVSSYIDTLHHSIDHALALSYRRNPYDAPRKSAFVAHISLVKGVPFFGYHVGYKYYLKVYMLNPLNMTRFADLLQQGAIMKKVLQPYEAHLQFLLQWMCDFNLYGCAYIETDKPHFRLPVPQWEGLDSSTHLWHDRSVVHHPTLDEDKFPRQSHCQLEVDIRVEDILNRHDIQPRPLHHSFIERLASLENLPPEEKLVHSMAGLWKDETRRRKRRMGITDPSSSPFPAEVLVSMSADPRNTEDGGWIHEEEFREMIANLAKQEHKHRGGVPISFETFGSNTGDENDVQTVLSSVQDLFHDQLSRKLGIDPRSTFHEDMTVDNALDAPNPKVYEDKVVVDEATLAQFTDDLDFESDEEQAREKALTQRQTITAAGLDNGFSLEAKLTGEADAIGNAAAQIEDAAVPEHAVRVAENGLKRAAPTMSQGPFKRTKPAEATQDDSRRVKFRVKDVKTDKRTSFVSTGVAEKTATTTTDVQLPSSSNRGPPSSQRSSQSSQPNRLHLPVIKPNSDRTSSQRSKDASFHSSDGSNRTKQTDSMQSSPGKPRINANLLTNYPRAFQTSVYHTNLLYGIAPPTCEEVTTTVTPSVVYQDAYYSDERDVSDRPREYGGQEFKLMSNTLPFLPEFDASGAESEYQPVLPDKAKADLTEQRLRRQCSIKGWEISAPPPTYLEVAEWATASMQPTVEDDLDQLEVDGPPTSTQIKRKNRPAPELSQIEGPTQKNKHGFKFSQKKASTSVQHETGYMSTMSLEVHANSRGDLAPDPERDEVNMVTWSIADDQMDEQTRLGILVLNKDDRILVDQIRSMVGEDVQIDAEDTELDLFNRMVDIVREYDPDVLTGFEVHNGSWGYLIERARIQYEFNLPDEFSRMKSQSHGRFGKEADRWGFTQTSTVRVTGRHTINIWRAMRSELNLLQYTMENVVFNLLHQRIPHYPPSALTKWYTSGKPKELAKVLDYFVSRTKLDLKILDANELIPRTSEQARLLGVDFFSVFSRGSQYKVESLMFRIAKPESFVLVSPSRKQVGAQNALECLPLVMEPQSAFYPSPLLVLDFQSLYPSVMIAYNYCYSTCLGRIVNWRGTNKMGFADFQRTPGLLELVKDKLNIAPNGMMYVKPEMRKSLLAKMLGEILETRVMVKSGMKVDKNDKTLQQLLNNRQLALKLIANVTYGYTSASFSGRMPCSEIADSIVQTGRETLEKAIALIHSVERWGAEVVYGDTDSLFIYLKGRTRADAFRIGQEIAKAVTDANPRPVKLKFEKVYHPCVLLAKKRYVGFKYESPDQVEPEFDAKGIETVRRDGTPAEQKIEEKALKLLFRTADLSKVKQYFQAQCAKIMAGKISVQDFCFAKEVKLGSYSDKGVPPPGALIATKRMLRDPRTEPQYGERVPYVVIAGGPGARLWERCVEPERLIHDEFAELDAEYYINKNLIPPLERIFNLVGANVRQWYDEMPKVLRVRTLGGVQEGEAAGKFKKTMESYMGSSICMVCRARLPPITGPTTEVPLPLCQECRQQRTQETIRALWAKLQQAEQKARSMEEICRSCANLTPHDNVRCDSRDCPVFYSRVKAQTQLRVAKGGLGKVVETLQDEATRRASDEW